MSCKSFVVCSLPVLWARVSCTTRRCSSGQLMHSLRPQSSKSVTKSLKAASRRTLGTSQMEAEMKWLSWPSWSSGGSFCSLPLMWRARGTAAAATSCCMTNSESAAAAAMMTSQEPARSCLRRSLCRAKAREQTGYHLTVELKSLPCQASKLRMWQYQSLTLIRAFA